MIVTFCGHSQYIGSGEDEQKIISLLSNIIGDCHAELYLGGYGSFDEFARKCGKKYQDIHPNTKLILVTPYITIDYQKNHLDYNKDLYDEAQDFLFRHSVESCGWDKHDKKWFYHWIEFLADLNNSHDDNAQKYSIVTVDSFLNERRKTWKP